MRRYRALVPAIDGMRHRHTITSDWYAWRQWLADRYIVDVSRIIIIDLEVAGTY